MDDSKIYAALAEMISSAALHTPRGVQLSQPVTPSENRSGGDWKPSKRLAIIGPLTEVAARAAIRA